MYAIYVMIPVQRADHKGCQTRENIHSNKNTYAQRAKPSNVMRKNSFKVLGKTADNRLVNVVLYN